MKISKVEIKNFRLLSDVSLSLEEKSTVIVGRNNSGKTSLTEVFRRLLLDKSPNFSLHDFSISSISGFERALRKKLEGAEEAVIRAEIPSIEVKITISYDPAILDFGPLSDFIIDLDIPTTTAIILVKYQLGNGKINDLFAGIADASEPEVAKLIKSLRETIPKLFTTTIWAIDPTDPTNTSVVELSKFKQLMSAGFINAQRGLDDITSTEKDVLGKVLTKLFKTANTANAPDDIRLKSEALEQVVKEIQEKIDSDFNEKLDELLPALKIFGYPGLADPNLSTETTLDMGNILESHTKLRYGQTNGLFLPETYNGLGSRNLIYILFQLFEFFKDYQTSPITPGIFLIFIEEPEAHLHPQMQQVFIKQLTEIANQFSTTMNGGVPWPVQFIVTTHSTHIANETEFESIRYFLTSRGEFIKTRIKDLREEFKSEEVLADKEFLHKYLTLTRCDLFFADKAILIEGPTERILMPKIIEKVDVGKGEDERLSSQYLTTIEIGGAYAHHFYKFLDFLEMKTLIITDIDSVSRNTGVKVTYPACEVAQGAIGITF